MEIPTFEGGDVKNFPVGMFVISLNGLNRLNTNGLRSQRDILQYLNIEAGYTNWADPHGIQEAVNLRECTNQDLEQFFKMDVGKNE